MPWWSTFCQQTQGPSKLQKPWDPSHYALCTMAKPELHQLQYFFFFCSILLCFFFHCTLSLINPEDVPSWLSMETEDVNMVQTSSGSWNKCDFSVGKWVFDQSYPLYDSNCPYLSTAVTCQKNGRPDSDYEKWKWKPDSCSMPRCLYQSKLDHSSHCYPVVFLGLKSLMSHDIVSFYKYSEDITCFISMKRQTQF